MSPVRIALTLLILCVATAVWWFVFDSRAPAEAIDEIPLAGLRAQIAEDDTDTLPQYVELYRVGTGEAPMLAVESGRLSGKFTMAFTAFGVVYADDRVMIDAAVDRATAETIGDQKKLRFDDPLYSLLLERMAASRAIVMTHEHKDHVMAVVRNPALEQFAERIHAPETQKYGLERWSDTAARRSVVAKLADKSFVDPKRLAPGIAVVATPGHSPGSLSILVRVRSGREYLFIGDIAWSFDDILRLKTRPRFLQWLMFDPNEDRPRVLRQLRALHDLRRANPSLTIVPSHDSQYFDNLLSEGLLVEAQSAGRDVLR